MFSIEKNSGLYSELLLLLDYIDDYEDLEWLGYLKHKWESEGAIDGIDLDNIVSLIDDYLPPEIECDSSGCYLVNEKVSAYTSIEGFEEQDILGVPTKEIVNF